MSAGWAKSSSECTIVVTRFNPSTQRSKALGKFSRM